MLVPFWSAPIGTVLTELATRSDGRFLLETVAVGTYRVEVRALGFRPETRSGIVLALGTQSVTVTINETTGFVAIP